MEKQVFDTHKQDNTQDSFTPKKTFSQENITVEIDKEIEIELHPDVISTQFESAISFKSSWWKKWLIGATLLFTGAIIAQSIQWLINTWQNHQWIYFSFSIVSLSIVILGVTAIINEWRKLAKLKKRMILQEKSQQFFIQSAVNFRNDFSIQKVENAKKLCEELAKIMELTPQSPEFTKWKKQISEGNQPSEIIYLFSQIVLNPIDLKVQKLISKCAIESAVVVAISPLAIVDVFFVAWRNIQLINQIARLYNIELGYISRLRLLRIVLLNMAFAGATEVIHDIGMDWVFQDLSAKLSGRIVQGIGIGLLSARLGLKAMAFCRPVAFNKKERPKLKHIQKEMFSHLTSLFSSTNKEKSK